MAVSFTSEAAAREGEPKEPTPELQVQLEMAALRVGEPEFFDLKQPGELTSWLGLSGGAGERLTLPPDGRWRPGETPVRTAVGRH
jgi:hypothetical protein